MSTDQSPPAITVQDLHRKISDGKAPVIIDVREPHELEIANLPASANSLHIPLAQLASRLSELDACKENDIVVYCRSGGRSMMACSILRQHGFKHVFNLTGGILAWSKEIDPSVQQY